MNKFYFIEVRIGEYEEKRTIVYKDSYYVSREKAEAALQEIRPIIDDYNDQVLLSFINPVDASNLKLVSEDIFKASGYDFVGASIEERFIFIVEN